MSDIKSSLGRSALPSREEEVRAGHRAVVLCLSRFHRRARRDPGAIRFWPRPSPRHPFCRAPSADDRQRAARHPAHHQAELEPCARPAGAPGIHPAATGFARPAAASARTDAERGASSSDSCRSRSGADRRRLPSSRRSGRGGFPRGAAGHHRRRGGPAPLRPPARREKR